MKPQIRLKVPLTVLKDGEIGTLISIGLKQTKMGHGKGQGFKKRFDAPFFKEFVVETPLSPKRIIRSLMKRNLIAGIDLGRFDPKLKNCLLVCVTEKRTKEENTSEWYDSWRRRWHSLVFDISCMVNHCIQ